MNQREQVVKDTELNYLEMAISFFKKVSSTIGNKGCHSLNIVRSLTVDCYWIKPISKSIRFLN